MLPWLIAGLLSCATPSPADYDALAEAVHLHGCDSPEAGNLGWECRELDVHFVVLTPAGAALTESDARNEIDILNERFLTETGQKLARFRLRSFTSFDAALESPCSLVDLALAGVDYSTADWVWNFNACDDAAVRDPGAINFYVYDAYTDDARWGDNTSMGRNNGDRPYVFLDISRLSHTTMSPEEHEMGHALGLGHVCEESSDEDPATSIMATGRTYGDGEQCPYGGGDRTIGFYPDQVRTLVEHIDAVADWIAER